MSIRVDEKLCNGCRGAGEPLCVRICPGNLLKTGSSGPAEIREPGDCWDCTACVKACPCQAIALYLPAQIGGHGATLKARQFRDKTIWTCRRPDGKAEEFNIKAEKIV